MLEAVMSTLPAPKYTPYPVTVHQHVVEQQRRHPTATGEFTWMLEGITLASRIIAAKVRRAGLLDVLGETQASNVSGDIVQKLDMIANQVIISSLAWRENIGLLASEENDQPLLVKDTAEGKYIVIFDPLDGSSNIDVNVSVGTIFSILRRDDPETWKKDHMQQVLQPGTRQIAAGYMLYGSSVVMVYTTGDGVHMFTLDPMTGAYVLCNERVRIPAKGRTYSVNEGNAGSFPIGYQKWLEYVKSTDAGPYTSRYVGTLVADFHRTLLRGGIFVYPPTRKAPQGKLRLLYEANPMAMIVEQAGGKATDGRQRILDLPPTSLHQRVPLVIGSAEEVDRLHEFLTKYPA
jgi:fructose-1,6-bisphosphatase I